ncbi:MAG: macro domain-containing protein [Nanoarchaeota archaeon]
MIKEINCDIFEAPIDVLGHCCNCFNTMGGGIALEIAKRYPKVKEVDSKTIKGDKNKLGTVSMVSIGDSRYIANMYGQYQYGIENRHLNYESFYSCLKELDYACETRTINVSKIGLPYKIGCGSAGGSWKIVREMIYDVFENSNKKLYICKNTFVINIKDREF